MFNLIDNAQPGTRNRQRGGQMIRIGENLNVMLKKIGQAMKDRDPKPIQELAVAEAEAKGIAVDPTNQIWLDYWANYKKELGLRRFSLWL